MCVCVCLIKNETKKETWRPRDPVATFPMDRRAREIYITQGLVDIIYQRLIGAHLSTMPIIQHPAATRPCNMNKERRAKVARERNLFYLFLFVGATCKPLKVFFLRAIISNWIFYTFLLFPYAHTRINR